MAANPHTIAAALAAQKAAREQNVMALSPLTAQYNQWTAGQQVGPALPRPIMDFLTGAMGPLTPQLPMPIDSSDEASGRPLPRRWQYQVGWNLPVGQPGTEGLKLAGFATLRAFADRYSVVRAMLNVRREEMAGFNWDVGPTNDAQTLAKGNKGMVKDQRERATKITKWFKKVDSNYYGFQSWFTALLEDMFVCDNVSVHILPTRGKGKGLFGSDLAELEHLNGDTIRPLLDIRGATPRPPAPAYQQYLWGVPRSDLQTVMTDKDLEEMDDALEDAGASTNINPEEEYRADQLLYLPRLRRSWTPYGFSAIEQALIPMTLGLNRQGFLLDYFTDGTIPGVYVVPGEQYNTPAQQRQLQDTLNALAGDIAWKHRVIVLPPGSSTDPQKDLAWQRDVDQTIVEQVGMILHVQPHEMGLTPGGKSAGLGGKGAVEGQQSAVTEQRTNPDRKWWKETLFDWVIQRVFGQDDLEWKWLDFEEEDQDKKIAGQVARINAGLTTIDQELIEDGKDAFDLPLTRTPFTITQPIPLDPTVQAPAAPGAPGGLGPDGQPLLPGAPPAAGGPPGAPPGAPRGGPPGAAPGKGPAGTQPSTGAPSTPPGFKPPTAAPGPTAPPAQPVKRAPFERVAATPAAPVDPRKPAPAPLGPGSPAADETGQAVVHHDGTPATMHADGGVSEPASGILFDPDELDQLLDVSADEVEALLDGPPDAPAEDAQKAAAVKDKPAAKPDDKPAAKWTPEKKEEPRFISGRLNAAYTTGATNDDVHTEVHAIQDRKGGSKAAVIAQFQQNLRRKVHAAIIALAVRKFGRVPPAAAVVATQAAWEARWLDKFTAAAQREMAAHNHPAHADAPAHEGALAQMHLAHVARGQDKRGTAGERRIGEDRRKAKSKVAHDRRQVDDRREGDRRGAKPEDVEPAEKVDKYSDAEPRDWHGRWGTAGDDIGPKVGVMAHMVDGRIHEDPVHRATDGRRMAVCELGRETVPARLSTFGATYVPAFAGMVTVAALLKGRVRYEGDLTDLVHRYLLRSYPPKVVEWTSKGDWHYDPHVPLKDINFGRRPGGRNPDKVASMAKALEAGASLDPMVLIERQDKSKYRYDVADGWHRTMGAEEAGWDAVPAFVGTGFADKDDWGIAMQAESDSVKKTAHAELAVLRRFLRKGGIAVNFRTAAIDAEVMKRLAADLDGGAELDAALKVAHEQVDAAGDAIAVKYDESEERDERGRWTRAGDSAGSRDRWGSSTGWTPANGAGGEVLSGSQSAPFENHEMRADEGSGGNDITTLPFDRVLEGIDEAEREKRPTVFVKAPSYSELKFPLAMAQQFARTVLSAAKESRKNISVATGLVPYDLAGARPSPDDEDDEDEEVVKYSASQPRDEQGRFVDAGSHDPTVLDVTGSPWKDAAGVHNPGWGPRGKLNDKGEELLYNGQTKEKYAVPRGYHDVFNESYTAKGWSPNGDGVAAGKARGGSQHFLVRADGVETVAVATGTAMPVVSVDGQRIGTVSSQGSRWTATTDTPVADRHGTGARWQQGWDNKALAVGGLVRNARKEGLVKVAYKYDPSQPRDDAGRWTEGDGGGGKDDTQSTKPDATAATQPAGKPDAQSTATVEALLRGEQPEVGKHDVGRVLDACLGRSDNPDLTELKVKGTLKFGGDGLGIARADMPQVPKELRKQFRDDLRTAGIDVTKDEVKPEDLKPIQKEISATSVAGMLQKMRTEGLGDTRILVSKDGYVVDGHHHWGAATALSFEQKGVRLGIWRVNADHETVMKFALDWDQKHGVAQRAIGKVAEPSLLAAIEAELAARGVVPVEKSDHGDQHGWEHVEEGERTKKAHRPDPFGPGIAGVQRDGKRYGVGVGKDKNGVFVMTHRARSKSYAGMDDIPTSVLEFIDSTG